MIRSRHASRFARLATNPQRKTSNFLAVLGVKKEPSGRVQNNGLFIWGYTLVTY